VDCKSNSSKPEVALVVLNISYDTPFNIKKKSFFVAIFTPQND